MNITPTNTVQTTTSLSRHTRATAHATRLVGVALVALAALTAPSIGPLGAQSAHADETMVTYAASGSWHAAVHTVTVTTGSGVQVRLPLHLYVPGEQYLGAARNAQITTTQTPRARGGTDVEVTVRVTPELGGKAIPVNGAVRGVDVPDGEHLFVQRGGNSSRQLIFHFHLERA